MSYVSHIAIILLPIVGLFFSLQPDTSASRLRGCDCLTFFFHFSISLLGIPPPMYRQVLHCPVGPVGHFLLQPHASVSQLRGCVKVESQIYTHVIYLPLFLMYLYPGWSPTSTIDKGRQADVQASRIIYIDTAGRVSHSPTVRTTVTLGR